MKFYYEPELQGARLHPRHYSLHVTGPGRFHGYLGVIHDAEMAELIVRLLNEHAERHAPRAMPPGWKPGDPIPND